MLLVSFFASTLLACADGDDTGGGGGGGPPKGGAAGESGTSGASGGEQGGAAGAGQGGEAGEQAGAGQGGGGHSGAGAGGGPAGAGAGGEGETGGTGGDPCAGVTCDGHGTCRVADGSAACRCDSGYARPPSDATTCEDIDECENPASCDSLTTCSNLPGSFSCSACPPGYDGNGQSGCTPRACSGAPDPSCACIRVAPDGDDELATASGGVVPFENVQTAIDFADEHRSHALSVCVAEGATCGSLATYPGPDGEDLTMRDGISVYGNYESSAWTRCSQAGTTLAPATSTGVLFDSSIDGATVLDGFTIAPFGAETTTAVTIRGARGASVNVSVGLRAGLTNLRGIDVSAGADAAIRLSMQGLAGGAYVPIPGETIGIRVLDSKVAINESSFLLLTGSGGSVVGISLANASQSSIASTTFVAVGYAGLPASLGGIRIRASNDVTVSGGSFASGRTSAVGDEAFAIDAEDAPALSIAGSSLSAVAQARAYGLRAAGASVSMAGNISATGSSAQAVRLEDAPGSDIRITGYAAGVSSVGLTGTADTIAVTGASEGTMITQSELSVLGRSVISLEGCADGVVTIADNPMIRLQSPGFPFGAASWRNEAIRAFGGCHARIESNTIRAETLRDGSGRTQGMNLMTGIACGSIEERASLCTIHGNDIAITTGGLTIPSEVGSIGIACDSQSCDVISENRFVGELNSPFCHSGCKSTGGGIYAGASRIVSGNFIRAGCSIDGVGLAAGGRVENNIVVGPTCGSGLALVPNAAVGLEARAGADVHSNTIIAGGQMDISPGMGLRCVSTGIRFGGTAAFRNNIVDAGDCDERYCFTETTAGTALNPLENNDLVPAPVLYYRYDGIARLLTTPGEVNALPGASGNISVNPLFANRYSDQHLQSGSLCIDAGTTSGAPLVDFDGDGRVPPPDIGADEMAPVLE